MKVVYLLYHLYSKQGLNGENHNEFKDLGYFSSKTRISEAIQKYEKQPGFYTQKTKHFKIKKWVLIFCKSKVTTLFELYHSYLDVDGTNNFSYIGLYCTKEKAEKAKNRLIKQKAIYKKYEKGFDISEELLDCDYNVWGEGYDDKDAVEMH